MTSESPSDVIVSPAPRPSGGRRCRPQPLLGFVWCLEFAFGFACELWRLCHGCGEKAEVADGRDRVRLEMSGAKSPRAGLASTVARHRMHQALAFRSFSVQPPYVGAKLGGAGLAYGLLADVKQQPALAVASGEAACAEFTVVAVVDREAEESSLSFTRLGP